MLSFRRSLRFTATVAATLETKVTATVIALSNGMTTAGYTHEQVNYQGLYAISGSTRKLRQTPTGCTHVAHQPSESKDRSSYQTVKIETPARR